AIAQSSRPKRKPLLPSSLFNSNKTLFLFLATSLRKILLALCVTPTPKAPPVISLLSKVSNFANLFSKKKASALLLYYSS
ncbi:hypothetical protein L249_7074, partial [Ophiocordyceps polyrhachis-furcata BCC 54312]